MRLRTISFAALLLAAISASAQAQGWRPSGDRTRDSLDIYRESLEMMPDSVLKWIGMTRSQFVHMGLLPIVSPESIFAGPDRVHRSDAEMTKRFLAHEKEFQRLVAMFQADTAFDRVFGRTMDFSQDMKRMPSARYAEYERLFAVTGVFMLVREDDVILMRTTTTHTFDRKGYVWSPKPLRPVVTGETHEVAGGEWRVFKPLKPRWAIYFQPMS